MKMDAASEEEFVSTLESEFVKYGWDDDREVVADEGSDRTDLIVQYGGCGPLGIEATYLTDQPARRIAEAIRQIEQYRRQRFDGAAVDCWTAAPHLDGSWNAGVNDPSRVEYRYIRGLLNNLGIGFINTYTMFSRIEFGTVPDQRFEIRAPPENIPSAIQQTVRNKRL
jgi:hypothetical protein